MTEPRPVTSLTPREHVMRWMRIVLGTFRYWPAMVIAATIAAGAAFVAPLILKPVYESTTVLLHRELISTTSILGVREYQVESSLQRNTRLREMLLSRTTLQKIVEDLGLYPEIVASRGLIDAVEELRLHTECKVGSANTFAIKHEGYDPEVVYKVTQRLGETLSAQSAAYRLEQAESTKAFLEAQHAGTRKELDASEQALAHFLAEHPEFAYDVTAAGLYAPGASLRVAGKAPGAPGEAAAPAAEKAASEDPLLLALERQAERLRRRIYADDARNAAPAPVPVSLPRPAPRLDPKKQEQIDSAQRELAAAQAELTARLARFTPKHPDVMAQQQVVDAAKAKLAAAKSDAIPEVDSPYDDPVTPTAAVGEPLTAAERAYLQKRLSAVNDKIAKARGQEASGQPVEVVAEDEGERIVALETRWAAVNRELDAIRERDQRIQRQLFEASIVAKVEQSGNASQMVVIDEPYKPERPARRGPRRTAAMTAAAVMAIGLALALLLSILDDRPHDEVDLRRLNLGPIAHVTPFERVQPQPRRANG
jgi:capsular polysaccharide biosynthesis protein